MIIVLITVIHIIVCAFLIIVVLLQSGQGVAISPPLSAAWAARPPSARAAPLPYLSKATTWSAVIFMVTSITLSILCCPAWQYQFCPEWREALYAELVSRFRSLRIR